MKCAQVEVRHLTIFLRYKYLYEGKKKRTRQKFWGGLSVTSWGLSWLCKACPIRGERVARGRGSSRELPAAELVGACSPLPYRRGTVPSLAQGCWCGDPGAVLCDPSS